MSSDSVAHKSARYLLVGALVLLGGWMLRGFLPALCWAVVLAIASSGLYESWLARFRGRRRELWAALTFTTILGVLVVAPLIYGGLVAVREAIGLLHGLAEQSRSGPPPLPDWLTQLPVVGDWIQSEWTTHLGNIDVTTVHDRPQMVHWTRELGQQILRRVVTLGFTLLTLFFVCLHRGQLTRDVPRAAERLFGPTVHPVLRGVVGAIRATVDGIVLVAAAEGAIMSGVYALVSTGHPILLGALTGVFAMIPFAAPVVFGAVAVVLILKGALGAGITVAAAGVVVLFIADHFVRPVIIGEGARLPFLWVLLGILGGVESFGLVGLFLGPALMAALVEVWRSWLRGVGSRTDPSG
ncbi:MAG TPA: AI-2E family transporter [Steroidobacteraceae bacterium]|nr:AI-2E family transporter [Steroidobacteraceae bacterium]